MYVWRQIRGPRLRAKDLIFMQINRHHTLIAMYWWAVLNRYHEYRELIDSLLELHAKTFYCAGGGVYPFQTLATTHGRRARAVYHWTPCVCITMATY